MTDIIERIKEIFSFMGRTNRKQFAIGLAISFLVILVFEFLTDPRIVPIMAVQNVTELLYIAAQGLLYVWVLSLIVRRFHDINITGWAASAPVILDIVMTVAEMQQWPIIDAVATGINLIILLVLVFKKGAEADNRYGAPPVL